MGFALFLVGAMAMADEGVLIDFAKLVADYPSDSPVENSHTLVDYGEAAAGGSYSDEDRAKMKTSLAPGSWEVRLASSSRTVFNQSYSMAKQAMVKEDAKKYAGEGVLAVRIHFPNEPFNSWAIIKPPFEIPAYMDATQVGSDGKLTVPQEEARKGRKFDNYGVLKNVGVIQSISVNVHGLNFPQGLSLLLKDAENRETQVFMGYLNFDGWRTLTWQNPNYINEVRNRELRTYPLYPKSAPLVKLAGLIVNKDADQEGGDFITYIKDIKIVYDKALLQLERDIDDEGVWNILQDREEARRKAELKRLGDTQVLRYLEKMKMHQKDQTAGAQK